MVDTEDYFPRGGKKPTTKFFKQSANFLGAPEKADRKKRKSKKKSEEDDGYLSDEAAKDIDQSYRNCGVWLKYSVIKEGLLLLGRVRQAQDTRVYVSLPCRLSGVVMACHVSEAYNKLLEAYVNDQIDKVQELQQMFRPGQYVALRVLEVASEHLMLSMMPQHVNSGKMQADLHKGALLQAAVSSVEDHGYVMDIGIPNVRAFLPKNAANPEINLDTGMVTWCCVTSAGEGAAVALSGAPAALQRAFTKRPAGALLPASAVDFTVDKALDNGIEGHVFGDRTAYVQRQHVDGKRPSLGQRIRARVLYVLPTTNTPFLTMRNIFETSFPNMEQEQRLQEGDIVDDAQVVQIVGRTVYLKLGELGSGLLSLRRIQVDEELQDRDVVAKSYPIGSKHRVRVLRYNMCDYCYSVTDERAVLEQRYFSLAQLAPALLVDATVASVADSHVILQVGRVTGYVPQAHLTDAGVFIDPKKASNSKLTKKKFKVGQEVRARVLAVEPDKRSLFLTLKPSLLAPDLAVLKSYEEAEVGKSYIGTISHIKDYLVVSFFNNVHAFVARARVAATPPPALADAFHLGQIVNCTVLRVDPEKRKISGSLITAPFTPSENRDKSAKRKKPGSEHPNKTPILDSEGAKNKNKFIEDNTESVDIPDALSKKRRKNVDEESEVYTKESKKKKKKESQAIIENDSTENELMEEESSGKRKKKRKLEHKEESTETCEENEEDTEHDTKSKKKKKKDKQTEEIIAEQHQVTDESDAIETDIYEESDHLLTPQDLGLIDMSDCTTAKQFKKRVVSLLKSVKARTRRIETIEMKIVSLENTGLTAKNKKYHTAMHSEKLVIVERIKKLLAALEVAQKKLKEFGVVEQNKDYKKKDKKQNQSTVASDIEMNNSSRIEKTEKVSKKNGKEDEKELVDKLKGIKVVEDLTPALVVPSAKDFWSASEEPAAPAREDSSSSEEEEEEKSKKKRKKLSAAEKVAKARQEEEHVRALEARAAAGDRQPRSCEQFERALLARPAAAQLWVAYMAFHLQATELEKARAVARRALAAIPFREEGERLNVWLALLNLEHRFGTKESQQKTLEEALQMNEPFQVHAKLLDIYAETGRAGELAALAELMARRYRRQPEVYPLCGAACYAVGLREKARQLMQKGIAALEKKDHVSLLVQFAQLERNAGERERAEALFEQVLAVYPRRVDVCAQYADMLASAGDVDRVRQVMDRMTSLNLPARKMKILFKKWIALEEKIGDKEHAELVRQRATEFIDKAKF